MIIVGGRAKARTEEKLVDHLARVCDAHIANEERKKNISKTNKNWIAKCIDL